MSQSRYRNRRRHNNTNSGTGIASDTGLDVTIMPRAPISPRPSPLAREFVPGLSAETRASPATPQNPQQRVAAQAALQTPEALARDPAQVPGSPTVQQAPRSSVSTRTRSRVNIPPAQLSCKFFRAGYCARGDTCWFKHEAPTSPAPVEPPDATSPAPASGASDDEAEPCAICFDKPETFGLMTGCNHVFCLGCIRKWRCSSTSRSAPQDPYADDPNALASTSKTCPLCRIRTRYIIPSVTWPQDSTQKATIERVYLLRLSKIPCRYFTASLRPRERPVGPTGRAGPHTRRNTGPWCPFGNECHYQHEKVPGVKYEFSEAQVSRAMWGRRAAVRRRNDSSFGDMERDLSASIDQLGVFPDWVIRFVDNPFTAESLADLIIQRDEGSDSDDRWDEAVRTELFDLEHVLGGRF